MDDFIRMKKLDALGDFDADFQALSSSQRGGFFVKKAAKRASAEETHAPEVHIRKCVYTYIRVRAYRGINSIKK